jgi:hypothetical protein
LKIVIECKKEHLPSQELINDLRRIIGFDADKELFNVMVKEPEQYKIYNKETLELVTEYSSEYDFEVKIIE